MAYKKTTAELKAELADARRTIRELEEDNDELQDRLDAVAGIVVEDEDEEEDEEDEDGDEDELDDEVSVAC
jgi:hypothetical protein